MTFLLNILRVCCLTAANKFSQTGRPLKYRLRPGMHTTTILQHVLIGGHSLRGMAVGVTAWRWTSTYSVCCKRLTNQRLGHDGRVSFGVGRTGALVARPQPCCPRINSLTYHSRHLFPGHTLPSPRCQYSWRDTGWLDWLVMCMVCVLCGNVCLALQRVFLPAFL